MSREQSNDFKVPQGKIVDNKRYIWRCPHPYKNDGECIWCFNGDKDKILVSLKTSRGQHYYGNLKAYLSLEGEAINDKYDEVRDSQGKFTMKDIIRLADYFRFPRTRIKALVEWLEETERIRHGTYDRLRKSPSWKPTKMEVEKWTK